MRSIILLLLAFLITGVASAADSGTVEPSSGWGIDYGEDRCTLYRSFGAEKDKIILQISAYSPGDSLVFRVVGKDIRVRQSVPLIMRIEPESVPMVDEYPIYISMGDGLTGVNFTRSLRDQSERNAISEARDADWTKVRSMPRWSDDLMKQREKDITHITIERGFSKAVRLHIGAMDKPMEAMRGCLNELIGHWGIDAEAQKTLSRMAMPTEDPGTFLKSSDYPSRLLDEGYQGLVDFRMMIDENGDATDCIVQEATSPRDFAELGCKKLIARAKFLPALDKDGKPIKSYWGSRMKWAIPSR